MVIWYLIQTAHIDIDNALLQGLVKERNNQKIKMSRMRRKSVYNVGSVDKIFESSIATSASTREDRPRPPHQVPDNVSGNLLMFSNNEFTFISFPFNNMSDDILKSTTKTRTQRNEKKIN